MCVDTHTHLGLLFNFIDQHVCFYAVCFYYYSFIVELKIWDGKTSESSFTVQDCFSYPEFLNFPYEVELSFQGL